MAGRNAEVRFAYEASGLGFGLYDELTESADLYSLDSCSENS